LKVLIINNDFPVYWRGRLIYLEKFLSGKKISFYAIELFGKGSPYSFDTYSYSSKYNWWSCLFPDNRSEDLSGRKIKKALFSQLDIIKPDIIITSSIVFYAGALGIRWAKKNKKKIIMFDDAKPSQVKRKLLIQRVKNLITKQVDGLWLPSKDYYKDYAIYHQSGIHFFYGFNCVDNQAFKCCGDKPSFTKTMICVARLVPVKNIDNLLKSWKFIEEKQTGYRLKIIGDGPEFDRLNKLRLILNLDTVEFWGAMDNSVIPGHYCGSEAFVLPSLSESWGLVVNEAMAAGLPVLLSNNINAAETLLKEGINGFAFNPLSSNSITETLLKYIQLPMETKKCMSENSLSIVNNMTYEQMGLQLYEALIKIHEQPGKRLRFLAGSVINLWYGRYNKSVWNKYDLTSAFDSAGKPGKDRKENLF
jgi:glycosyltransferase involved in cell wall biosynthesis